MAAVAPNQPKTCELQNGNGELLKMDGEVDFKTGRSCFELSTFR
jgi:hypothetical protein